jgi:hypothetical protein
LDIGSIWAVMRGVVLRSFSVDSAGFEPAASALRRQRSYQLSHEPSGTTGSWLYKGFWWVDLKLGWVRVLLSFDGYHSLP